MGVVSLLYDQIGTGNFKTVAAKHRSRLVNMVARDDSNGQACICFRGRTSQEDNMNLIPHKRKYEIQDGGHQKGKNT